MPQDLTDEWPVQVTRRPSPKQARLVDLAEPDGV
jgi:hypothetical protein